MKFMASIELKDGSVITLPLSCRECHAQKLQYVFSRTLDRSVVASFSVVACESAITCRKVFVPALVMEVK